MGQLQPMRGVCYDAVPCNADDAAVGGVCNNGIPPPALDVAQVGYANQWGPKGRDDLGTISTLGGNAVRLYHSFGIESKHDHGKFLDRAEEVGLHVLYGFHTQNLCDKDFNCFVAWKAAALSAFKNGLVKGGAYHPAVAMIVVQDMPDVLNFGGNPPPVCATGNNAKCRVKAALSALDGLLAAEKEAGITGTLPNLTISWSFDVQTSIDGKVSGEGYYGFQDMIAGTANPSIADYSPQTGADVLAAAFTARWVHSVSSHAPYSFIKEKVGGNYDQFLPTPWFVSSWSGDGMAQSGILSDLKAMDADAAALGPFLGVSVFSFQVDYLAQAQPGAVQPYGLFALGNQSSYATEETCQEDVNTRSPTCTPTWPVSCLDSKSPKDHRAVAASTAWGGQIKSHGDCSNLGRSKASALENPHTLWLAEHGSLEGCCGCDCHCASCGGACPPCEEAAPKITAVVV